MVVSFGSDVGILRILVLYNFAKQTQSQNFETLLEFKDKLNFHAIFSQKRPF